MSISVTIPQLFYDLIARVLPGFLFLFILSLVLSDVGFSLKDLEIVSATSSMATLINGLAFLVLCYFSGWVLRAFTLFSFEHKEAGASPKHREKQEDTPSLYEKFHRIRLKSETSGFRIVKLRAEVRMLEASRTAMCLILVIAVIELVVTKLVSPAVSSQPSFTWYLRLLLPAVLAFAFHISLGPATERYFGNIERLYDILFCEKNQR